MDKDKLILVKQAWAQAGRLLTGKSADHGERLPPGQKLVKDWPVLDLGVQPEISLQDYRLTVNGAVETPAALDWAALMALPQVERTSDMHCVTQWSNYDNRWVGIAASTIIDLVRPLPGCRHVIFHSYDDYTTNVRLEQFADDDVLLAHTWNGAPISRAHGGPLRGMVPKYYLWKSAKWLKRIEFSTSDAQGFWETRGYHNNADPWNEERYS
jgi:DMSO/TMAO reductase YedYZ molybdopterin-dependent catalytic subunit